MRATGLPSPMPQRTPSDNAHENGDRDRDLLPASDVLCGEPDPENRPAHIADGDKDVAACPRLRGGVEEFKAVAVPHDPRGDIDRRLGRDLQSDCWDRAGVADPLAVMDVDVGAEHLLGAYERRQILLHSNNCTTAGVRPEPPGYSQDDRDRC